MLVSAEMPRSYADMCAGLTQSGVTNLAQYEAGVVTFAENVVSSDGLKEQLRPAARMEYLEAVAIHLLVLDKWEDPACSVNRVINMAVSERREIWVLISFRRCRYDM